VTTAGAPGGAEGDDTMITSTQRCSVCQFAVGVGDSPIELSGDAEPLATPALPAVVDFILIAAGAVAVLAPFVLVFTVVGLRGSDPWATLPLGIIASVAVPSLLVSRFGTPTESARAKAGFSPVTVSNDTPAAPFWARAAALLLDVAAYLAVGIALLTVPVAMSFLVVAIFPVTFPVCVMAVGATVAAFVMSRRPCATWRSPGLTVCALRRERTTHGVRTVRALSLAGPGDGHADPMPRALALIWVAVGVPILAYWVFVTGVALVGLLFPPA
jgi:hypothetical protein